MAFWDEAGCKICVAESGFFFRLMLNEGERKA